MNPEIKSSNQGQPNTTQEQLRDGKPEEKE
jgi:hypothetical protein